MKILFLAPTNEFSGGENVTVQIAKQMKNRKHAVAYCCPVGKIKWVLQENEIPFIGLKKFSLKELRKAIKEYDPEIVYAMDYRASFYASLIFQNTIGHLHSDCPWLKRICPNSLALCITAFRAKHLICVSKDIPKNFVFSYMVKDKFTVFSNVISSQEILIKSQEFFCEGQYDLVYCVRFAEPKNPIGFLEIVAQLKKDIPQISAVMIGDGELRETVECTIEEYGLKETVDLKGFQINPFPFINRCKVMVMPSLWEGFPMVAIESLLLGKPLVATSVSGLQDIVTDECGGIGKTIEELAEKVKRCLKCTDEEYQKICERAQQAALPYIHMEQYINNIENIILESLRLSR